MIYEPAEDSFLLAKAVKKYSPGKSVLDMGSGSGIQAETALSAKAKSVLSADIDKETIKYLKSKNIRAVQSDLFSNIKNTMDRHSCFGCSRCNLGLKAKVFVKHLDIKGKFDLIIFNPPYLPLDSREDIESRKATTGGKKGDEIILKFLKHAKSHLNKKGIILLLLSSLTPRNKINSLLKEKSLSKKVIAKQGLFMEKLEVWEIRKDI